MNPLIDALDAACPGYVAEGIDAELPYIWVGEFVRHVILARLEGREDEVRAVFAVIETEVASKWRPHRDLAIIGFIEDLQNGNLHPDGSSPADFRRYLGPESLKQWDALNGFWAMVEHSKTGGKPGE